MWSFFRWGQGGQGELGKGDGGAILSHSALSKSHSAIRHDEAFKYAQGQRVQAAGVRILLTSSADKTTMSVCDSTTSHYCRHSCQHLFTDLLPCTERGRHVQHKHTPANGLLYITTLHSNFTMTQSGFINVYHRIQTHKSFLN